MSYRKAHGKGAKALARVETAQADELPDPVPAPMPSDGEPPRRHGSRFTAGNTESRKGGLAKAGKTRLAASLGLRSFATSEAFKPYRRSAETFRRHHCASLAAQAGGYLGSGPSSIVASAALALAASRYLFDLASAAKDPSSMAALFAQAARLADQHRQSLLTAYELAVREAKARPAETRSLAAFSGKGSS